VAAYPAHDRLLKYGCAFLMLVSCGCHRTVQPLGGEHSMPGMTLGAPDNGRSVALKRGETIALKLPEHPTTGFRWSMEHPVEPILELQRTEYVASGTALGSGGQHTFEFKARKAGEAHVALKRWREWEGEGSIVERYEITVRVND
jgi:inhibitor of cysteine peptidase